MSISPLATIAPVDGRSPEIAATVFIADGARVIGDVVAADAASIWYNAVLRADGDRITLGERANVQDGVVIHVDEGFPVDVGADVSIGHNAVVHGAAVGDGSLIGMGATLLNGSHVGAGCLVAAGSVVLEGSQIPDGSLVAGVPAKVRRALTVEEKAGLVANATTYLGLTSMHSVLLG